jgi:two-component system, NarL family, sensor histidine kinase UhpB
MVKLPEVARILTAVVVVQVVYWLAISPWMFSYAPMRNAYLPENLRVATPATPDLEAVRSAPTTALQFGGSVCCGPGYRAFLFDLNLADVPPEGLLFASNFNADNVVVFVNGHRFLGEGRMQLPDITYHSNLRKVVQIPAALVHAGRNEFVAIAVRDAIAWFDVHRPPIGPYAAMSLDIEKRRFMGQEYKWISIAIGIVLAALALLVSHRTERRRFGFWMLVLLAAWTLRTHYYVWTDPPFHGLTRLGYYFLLTTAMPLAWLNLANEWSGRPWRWVSTASVLAYAVAVLAIGHALGWEGSAGYDRASDLTNYFGIACGSLAVLRVALQFQRVAGDRLWEAAVIALCVSLVVVEFAQELLNDRSNGQMSTSLPILFTAFAMAFARDHLHLLRLTTERQRLMFDMHDGVGGRLAALLLAVRRNRVARPEIESHLAGALEELRLIIDSLDSKEANLSIGLANLREQLESSLQAAGIRLEWRNDLPLDRAEMQPATVVQVLRIVQEAVTNAIKHAGSDRLELAAQVDDTQPASIAIRIRDYGVGMHESAGSGHGVTSMQSRARAIGATLTIQPATPGTQLLLQLAAR